MVLTSIDRVQSVQQLRLTELAELQVGMAYVRMQRHFPDVACRRLYLNAVVFES